MKLALCADLHIGRDLKHDAPQLDAMVARCIASEVAAVLIAGDVFDRANVCTPRHSTGAVQAVLAGAVARLVDADIQIILIPGNHDKAGAGADDCLRFLDVLAPDVRVIREPMWINHGGVFVLCLPWVYGADAEETIRGLVDGPPYAEPKHSKTMLVAHVQVVGARMAGMRCCEGGSFAVSREFLESLPFTRYALGDFHARQDLFDGRGGYVGALRQGNFGEEGNPQGFEIWDAETNAVEWIELDAAPRHLTVECACESDMLVELANTKADGCIGRFVVHGWQPTAELVARAEAAGIRVDIEAERTERERRVDEVPAGILDDPHALIRLWAKQRVPALDDTDVARLTALHDEATADAPASARIVELSTSEPEVVA